MSAKASRFLVSDVVAMTNATMLAFRENSLDSDRIFGVNDGHRGTRQESACGARVLSDKSGGAFSGYFTSEELDFLLPRAIGANGASPWLPANTIAPFFGLVDKVAAIYLYNNLRINTVEITSQEAQFINWNFSCVGGLETEWVSAFPSTPATPPCGVSFAHSDAVFTYGGVVYPMKSFRLSINNMLDESNYESSLTPTDVQPLGLQVSLEVTCNFKAGTKALHRAAVAGDEASLVIGDGTTSYGFMFGNLKIPNGGPTIPAQGAITQTVGMSAYRKANTTNVAGDNQIRIVKTTA